MAKTRSTDLNGQLDLSVNEGQYRLQLRLGGGGFGDVYQGLDTKTNQEVAIKLEHYRIAPSVLQGEIDIYEELSGGPGFPRLYWEGEECEFRVMVFELLGPNLEELFQYCTRQFSLKTVLMLADQLVSRFKFFHSKGYIHRDIKPDNLLMGDGAQGSTVYVTDLGLGDEYRDRRLPSPSQHERSRIPVIGTPIYASINAHCGAVLFPADDMESLGYVLIYFMNGSLPWEGIKAETLDEEYRLIGEQKKSTTIDQLCKGLPGEFCKYFQHIRSLGNGKPPNYAYLRRLFQKLFCRKGYKYDRVFDWTVLKFIEYQGRRRQGSGS